MFLLDTCRWLCVLFSGMQRALLHHTLDQHGNTVIATPLPSDTGGSVSPVFRGHLLWRMFIGFSRSLTSLPGDRWDRRRWGGSWCQWFHWPQGAAFSLSPWCPLMHRRFLCWFKSDLSLFFLSLPVPLVSYSGNHCGAQSWEGFSLRFLLNVL